MVSLLLLGAGFCNEGLRAGDWASRGGEIGVRAAEIEVRGLEIEVREMEIEGDVCRGRTAGADRMRIPCVARDLDAIRRGACTKYLRTRLGGGFTTFLITHKNGNCKRYKIIVNYPLLSNYRRISL
jgi:hypothetical protein